MIGFRPLARALAFFAAAGCLACGASEEEVAPEPPAAAAPESPWSEPVEPARLVLGRIDERRLLQADSEPGSWMAHGRDYSEQRFSPLDQIHAGNVDELGLAWSFDLGSTRGVEATPIVVEGVMYVTGPWSRVFALDARTGELLWKYDPRVPGDWARHTCCDVVNRGVAVWKGSVYLGTLDGRLISLDGATGKVNWEIQTIDPERPYTITGAPRVVKDKVIIGNGGAEFGVRGYVSAYAADTGERVWRFFTVPGDPSQPFEHPELEAAAATWNGDWWTVGGGGTAWDSFAYDPALDLLYVGTGNSLALVPLQPAARPVATTSSSARSWRCARTPESSSGTTRPPPVTTGTTPPPSTSCSPTWRSTASCARC